MVESEVIEEVYDMKMLKVAALGVLVLVIFVAGAIAPPKTRNSFFRPAGYCAQCLEQMEGA
jgi:hypothetical protein